MIASKYIGTNLKRVLYYIKAWGGLLIMISGTFAICTLDYLIRALNKLNYAGQADFESGNELLLLVLALFSISMYQMLHFKTKKDFMHISLRALSIAIQIIIGFAAMIDIMIYYQLYVLHLTWDL